MCRWFVGRRHGDRPNVTQVIELPRGRRRRRDREATSVEPVGSLSAIKWLFPGPPFGTSDRWQDAKEKFSLSLSKFRLECHQQHPSSVRGGGTKRCIDRSCVDRKQKKVRANQKTETHARAQTTTPKNGRKPKMNNNTKRSVAPRQGSGSARKNGDRVVVVVIGGGGETTTFA